LNRIPEKFVPANSQNQIDQRPNLFLLFKRLPVHFRRTSIFLAVLLSLAFSMGFGGGIPSNSNGHAVAEVSKQGVYLSPDPGEKHGGEAPGEQLTASPPADFSPGGPSSVWKPEFIRLRIATYNVHRCEGLDGRILPGRVASVLRKLNPDIIALQEVVGDGPGGRGQEKEIGEMLGMPSVMAPARLLRGHHYGNALLSRFPIRNHAVCDLSQKDLEPRFCQSAEVLVNGHPVSIFNVHLGTSMGERARQARQLVPFLCDPSRNGPKILLGDFNEWIKGKATKTLGEQFQSMDITPFLKWPRTYPGFFPVFHIDHVYYQGPVKVVRVECSRDWQTILASDHIPIVAELQIKLER
jgi:endonuclease/exonuclease/phosphatase family metal-dependent hydrolase